jgi:hypothetical protein
MKPISILVSLLVLTISAKSISAEWNDCPKDTSYKSLSDWRNLLIQRIVKNDFKGPQDAISNCLPNEAPACFEDLIYYAKEKSGIIPNTVWQKESEVTISKRDQLPKEFWGATPDGVIIPKNILALAKEKKWKTVLYKTQSSGGFDDPPTLFLIAVPGKDTDIYIQISPESNNDWDKRDKPVPELKNHISVGQASMTIITVDKKKTPPVGQPRRISKTGDEYKWSNDISVKTCIPCHSVPLKPISPLGYGFTDGKEKMGPEQTKEVEEMNDLLRRYVSWGTTDVGNGNVKRLGPPMDSQPTGWAPKDSNTRTEDYIKDCAKYVGVDTPIDYKRIAASMNCVDCHNNSYRGVLHERFNQSEIRFKVLGDRSMPEDVTDLTKEERLVLVQCLLQEQSTVSEAWRKSGDWLRRTSCNGEQFKKPPVLKSSNKSSGTNATQTGQQ